MPVSGQESRSNLRQKASSNLIPQSHFSTLAGAHHFVYNGATYNVLGDCLVTASNEGNPGHGETSKGIVQGRHALDDEDVSLVQEVCKGAGYRIYSALYKQSGKIVAMKVYEGRQARERCSEAAEFMMNWEILHPNIPHLIGVSALRSIKPFLLFDGEYEGTVDRILGQVLQTDLKKSETLGLQTVAGLSSALNYLQDLEFPFASARLNNFLALSCKDKVIVAFEPENLGQIAQSDHEFGFSHNVDDGLVFFNQFCQKIFDDACKAHYERQRIQRHYVDVFDVCDPDVDLEDFLGYRFQEVDESSTSFTSPATPLIPTRISSSQRSPRRSRGWRQQLVWKYPTRGAVTLDNISHQFQDFLKFHSLSSEPVLNRRRGRYIARTSHRCPGYNRIEITLTTEIKHSAIVSHFSPTPGEICPVCKEIVSDEEKFNCLCGGEDHESIPTVRCSTCFEWHHQSCVNLLAKDHHRFVCARCTQQVVRERSSNDLSPNEISITPIGAPFLRSKDGKMGVTDRMFYHSPTAQVHELISSPPAVLFDLETFEYEAFLNQSPHRVLFRNQVYPTAMHLYEAAKFIDRRPDIAAAIRNCADVREVYPLALKYEEYQRTDWPSQHLNMMDEVLFLKFTQHPDLRIKLLGTREVERIIYTEPDDYWGIGYSGQGLNMFGKSLVRVRDII